MSKSAVISPQPGGQLKEGVFQRIRDNKICYVLVFPFMLFFTVFTILPVAISLMFSFTSFNILETPKFVGLDNYLRLFLNDDIFIKSVGNTLIMAIAVGPGGYILSLLLAWAINELQPKVRSLVALVFYIPSISGNVYIVWSTLFSGDDYGWLNGALLRFGIIQEPQQWLKKPEYMMPIIIGVALWGSLGKSFLAFIAGLQGIDRSYYEAAAVDGLKNRWQELWFITLPIMKPQLIFGAVMSITATFDIGIISTALCGMPSTEYAVHTMMNHLEDYGGIRYEMGYASAIATLLFIMMLACNKLFQKAVSKVGT